MQQCLTMRYGQTCYLNLDVTNKELLSLNICSICRTEGIPVCTTKPRIQDFAALFDKFLSRLSSWKSIYLSIGGRLTLVNSVLTALPIDYISTLLLPSEVIKAQYSVRRAFIWKRVSFVHCGLCLVAWHEVYLPRNMVYSV